MGLFYTQVFLPSRLFFPRRVFRTCNEAGQQNLRRKTLDREMQASPFFLPPLPCIIAGSRTTARATQVSIACIITITSRSERGGEGCCVVAEHFPLGAIRNFPKCIICKTNFFFTFVVWKMECKGSLERGNELIAHKLNSSASFSFDSRSSFDGLSFYRRV